MGIEPHNYSPDDSTKPISGSAKSGALTPENAPLDPALAAIIEAWSTLPEAIRAGILAMVRAARA